MCEVELHRLRLSTWTVAQDKKASTQKRDAARALKKSEKERVERNRQREKEAAQAEKQLAAAQKDAAKQAVLDEKLAVLAAKQAEVAEKQAAAAAKQAAAAEKQAAAVAQQAAAAAKQAPPKPEAAPAPVPAPAPAPATVQAAHTAAPAVESERERLLELYAQTKKSLEESKKNLSFLAIDVVNSTGMKLGEDPALAERDFRQYKKLVDRIITAHKGLKAAWTPDGVMICFASVQNAVQAAQELIRGLDHFNRTVKTIKADFQVRCGINAGSVMFDDTVRMEEMTDRHIDIAGHMQKYADPNTIYVGAHAIESIRAQFDFHNAEKKVDGHDVYAWRDDTAGAV
jgi:class 3 adenylate cyclase